MKTQSIVIAALFATTQAQNEPIAKDSALENFDPNDKNEAKPEEPPKKIPFFNEPAFDSKMPAAQGLGQVHDVYQEPAENVKVVTHSPLYFNETPFSGKMASSAGLVQIQSACAQFGISGVTCGPSDEELFATGMNGDEDLGEDITMKGDKFHFAQNIQLSAQEPKTGSTGGTAIVYDTKGYGPVEKLSFFDPKIAKAHTSFYAQAEPKEPTRNPNWAKYDTKGYGPVEKESFFDPKIAKAHTTFYAQEQPKTVEPEICANEATSQAGASQVPLSIDSTNPEKVHTLDPKICKSRTTFYHLNQSPDPVYSSTPAPYCSSSGWCGRQWFPAPEDKPAEPRIGHYDAEGAWIVPENLRGGNKQASALMQLRRNHQSPDPVYSSDPEGISPFCSSSGWCGHQWFPTPEEPAPAPRIGYYDTEGAWIVPEHLRGNKASSLMQLRGSNQSPDPHYSSTPTPFCSSSGWCGHQWFPTPEEPAPEPRIGHYDGEGAWIVPENLRGNKQAAALMQMNEIPLKESPETFTGVKEFNYPGPEQVHTLDPKIARGHTTFYNKK